MDSYDVIAEAVKGYWRDKYPQDVVAFFQQKYSWDDEWERCEELVECHGSDDYENMTFLSDFCEGQTDVKNVVIVPLREVTAFYSLLHKKPQTNADRIRSMSDEELATLLTAVAKKSAERLCESLKTVDVDLINCNFDILYKAHLDWLSQEAKSCS